MNNHPYRGRFAPSPSGPLHFGSLLAALGSYLQARSQHGQWFVRIEDIDPPREMKGASDSIIQSLIQYGFEWDDEIQFQSQHSERYLDALSELAKQGLSYPCTCSRKQLIAELEGTQTPHLYPGHCRNRQFPLKERHAIRVKIDPAIANISFEDRVQGLQQTDLVVESGDFIVQRSDKLFAYQLAVALDDALDNMSEIVRGADLLDSTPRQIYIMKSLGFKQPAYAHLPVATKADGAKLSKRSFSPAISEHDVITTLSKAMLFLGQDVPGDIEETHLQEFWDWAIANWQMDRVPRLMAIGFDDPLAGAPKPETGPAADFNSSV